MVEGSFTAGAVIESVIWEDDFNRVVDPGLGPGYTMYGTQGSVTDWGEVNGSEAIVSGPNHWTSYWFNPGIATSLTVQFDVWMQSAASQSSYQTYYWFAHFELGTDIYPANNPVTEGSPYTIQFEFWDKVANSWIWYDTTVEESTWYTYKIRRGGGEQKAKLWKRGDPEPDWQLVGGADDTPYQSWVTQLEIDSTYGEAGKVDNLRIWSFEVPPISSSFTADALKSKTFPGTFTANAELRDTNDPANRAITARAIQRVNRVETFSADSFSLKTYSFGPGLAAPSISSWSTPTPTTSQTISFGIPGGAVGDLLVAAIAYDGATATRKYIVPPGWWEITRAYPSDYDIALQVLGRIRVASEPTVTFTMNETGSWRRVGVLFNVSGARGEQLLVTTINGPTTQVTSHVIDPGVADNSVAGVMLVLAAGSISATWTRENYLPGGSTTTTAASLGYEIGTWAAGGNLASGATTLTPQGTRTLTSSVAVSDVMVALTWLRPTTGITANAFKLRVTFTADAYLRPMFFTGHAVKLKLDTPKAFTADAIVDPFHYFGSFAANAVILGTVEVPQRGLFTLYSSPISAQLNRAYSSTLNFGGYLGGRPAFVWAVYQALSGTVAPPVVPAGEPDNWEVLTTQADDTSRTRATLYRYTQTTTTSYFSLSLYDVPGSDPMCDWALLGVAYNDPAWLTFDSHASSIERTTETPTGEVAIPAVNVDTSGIVIAFSSIIASVGGNWTTAAGMTGVTSINGAAGAIRTLADHLLGGQPAGSYGPYATTYYGVTPPSPTYRVGATASLFSTGSIVGADAVTINADITFGVRSFASFTSNAWLVFVDAGTQQHHRGDAFHSGATLDTAVLTTATIGPWPVGSVVHDVLGWLWDQYSARTSINLIQRAFVASAIRWKAQSSSWTAAAWLRLTVTGSFTADAAAQRTMAAAATINAVRLATGSGSTSVAAIAIRPQEGNLGSDGVLLVGLTATATADAFVQPYFRADAWLADGSLEQTDTFTTDAVLLATVAWTAQAAATVMVTGTGSFTADSVRGATTTSSLAAAAFVQPYFRADAVITSGDASAFQSNAFQSNAFLAGGSTTFDDTVFDPSIFE